MKNLSKTLPLILFLIFSISFTSSAQVPRLINYQGRLTDAGNNPLDGAYSITFRIYDAETAGNLLWEENHSGVVIQRGVFSILLGSANPNGLDIAFDKPYWLSVKVGDDPEMSPRQQIASGAYAIRAAVADEAVNADTVDGMQGTILLTTEQTAGGDLNGTYPNPVIAPGAISQAKLKTAVGEVSLSQTGIKPAAGVLNWYHGSGFRILPGGEYGFTVQGKTEVNNGDGKGAWVAGYLPITPVSNRSSSMPSVIWGQPSHSGSSYKNIVTLLVWARGRDANATVYVRQRYVTSSGRDHWVFLLIDKDTKEVISSYQAPDHPSYGTAGTEKETPHPFVDYDPKKHKVVLLDNDILSEIKAKVTSKRSMLTVISEDYELDWSSKPAYSEREIIEIDEYGNKPGKVIAKIKTPEWAKLVIGRDEIHLKRRLVKALPKNISYKSLKSKKLRGQASKLETKPLAHPGCKGFKI